ncbi:MAG: SPFH domain-containing protein [Candidatus Woesearchaeota archaeon]
MDISIITSIILVICLILFVSGIRIVRPTHRGAVETLGKYSGYREAGFAWIFPIIQKFITLNVTERLADVEPLDMITKDNLNARVDLQVYFKIKTGEENIKNALYNVDDVNEQIIALAQTTARNIIGYMMFKDVNSERNKLNVDLYQILDKETKAWGIQIVRVELKEITPPRDVQETMNRVIKAENEKDAALDFATAKETEADGIKRAAIKVAEGNKQAAILEAEGKSKAFELINASFKGNAQMDKQLDVTRDSLKNNTKIVLTEKGISPTIILGEIPIKASK